MLTQAGRMTYWLACLDGQRHVRPVTRPISERTQFVSTICCCCRYLRAHARACRANNIIHRQWSVSNMYGFFFVCYPNAEALRLHGSRLSEYERQEIEKYPEIWFLGLESCKVNAKPGTSVNCGYDDDNGSYNKVSANLISLLLWRNDCGMHLTENASEAPME